MESFLRCRSCSILAQKPEQNQCVTFSHFIASASIRAYETRPQSRFDHHFSTALLYAFRRRCGALAGIGKFGQRR